MNRIRAIVSEETRWGMNAFAEARVSIQLSVAQGGTRAVCQRRQGMALMVMLVALGIVSTICVGLLKVSMTERHQARREANAAQARWLAESGVDLAAALLKRDEGTSETTWKVSAAQLGGPYSAIVTVTIARVEGAPRRRQVTVVAEYPATTLDPIRPRLVRFIDL